MKNTEATPTYKPMQPRIEQRVCPVCRSNRYHGLLARHIRVMHPKAAR